MKMHDFGDPVVPLTRRHCIEARGLRFFQRGFTGGRSPMQSAYTWQPDPLLAPSAVDRGAVSRTPWLRSASFDVIMLVASVAIVPLVLVAMWLGMSSAAINLGVTALVGGPHVFGTFTATFADRNFRRRNPWLIA